MPQTNRPAAWTQYGGPNRDFSAPAPTRTGTGFTWKRPLGAGASGIVTDGELLYTLYGRGGEEVVVAVRAATGQPVWERRYPLAAHKGQESLTGGPICPQATPAVKDGQLATLGFTGRLRVHDARTGKTVWERDLVADFDATPVQYGFSASPLWDDGVLVVHVGGRRHALVAFDPADGRPLWRSGPGEPSYATPVAATVDGERQWIQVTRDAILGLSARGGAERWRYPMPKPGLTNVPTPILLPGQRLLVSGQGVNGTRLLRLSRTGASEVWKVERTPFFYCNWIAAGDLVYGFAGNAVTALRIADGAEAWRERGQNEANAIRVGDETLWLRGDGLLTRSRVTAKGIAGEGSVQLLKSRCWTAPTLSGGTLFARDDRELAAIPVASVR